MRDDAYACRRRWPAAHARTVARAGGPGGGRTRRQRRNSTGGSPWRSMMVQRSLAFVLAVFVFAASAFFPASAQQLGSTPRDDVSVALVLAVDVSTSINDERFALQRRGYADAFTNPAVISAI